MIDDIHQDVFPVVWHSEEVKKPLISTSHADQPPDVQQQVWGAGTLGAIPVDSYLGDVLSAATAVCISYRVRVRARISHPGSPQERTTLRSVTRLYEPSAIVIRAGYIKKEIPVEVSRTTTAGCFSMLVEFLGHVTETCMTCM